MKIDIGITENDRAQIAEGLSRLLADTYTLYLKTHNFHWNVKGPMFQTLHLMFETHYTELALADLDAVEKQLQKVSRTAKSGDKEAVAMKALLEKLQSHLDEGKPLRSLTLDDNEQARAATLHLLTTKPTMYIANVNEDGFENN